MNLPESEGLHQSSLLHLGFLLFIITFIVLVISKLMLSRMDKNAGTKIRTLKGIL